MASARLTRMFGLLGLTVVVACSGPAGLGGAKGSKADDGETENKTPQDPKKPTDDSEGLPGYLTDPASVTVEKTDGKATVAAPEGSVKADGGSPHQVQVRIYEVEAEAFQTPREAEDGKARLPAHYLARSAANADGSFSVEVTLGDKRIVLVVLTPQASDDEVVVASGNGVVFGTADAPFAKVDPELLKEDRRPNESTATATSTATDTSTAAEAPCAGARVRGGCWYLSAAGGACAATCAGHGGYDEKTNAVAGFGGTLDACYEVLTALGVTGTDLGSIADAPGVGCSGMTAGYRVRWTYSPTTAEAVLAPYVRACACGN